MRSYQYRFYPPESPHYERCVGLSWCSGCRVYTGAMVHVPRDRALVDPLALLTVERRDSLRRSEVRLIEYLDSRCGDLDAQYVAARPGAAGGADAHAARP